MNSTELAEKGYTKWQLALLVTPVNVAVLPYKAALTISLTSKEKANRMAYVGAELPLRYDPLDLLTLSVDSIAMGYPDPYEDTLQKLSQHLLPK